MRPAKPRKSIAENIAARIAANQLRIEQGRFQQAAEQMREVNATLPKAMPDTLAEEMRRWLNTAQPAH